MRAGDVLQLSLRAVIAHRLRSALTGLGIFIGITAVVLLTSLGEGLRLYVLGEFTQFGTNIIAITPGTTSTFGLSTATISTVRPLSLGDAEALQRLPYIQSVVPVVQGNAAVEFGARERRTLVLGVGHQVPEVWKMDVYTGSFLPADDYNEARNFAVLGAKLRNELFLGENPLGKRIRIGGDRYRVTGVMAPKGQMLGFDLDDTVYLPVAKAMALFDRESLMEIDTLYDPKIPVARVEAAVKRLIVARHGAEDFTLVTQEQMLEKLDAILNILTFAVSALGGISLLVGAVGILTIMTIAVAERTSEIGLLRAIGAERTHIVWLFLTEAACLSMAGGVAGIAFGVGIAELLALTVPALPITPAWEYVIAAFVLSLLIGMFAGVFPALKAADLDPLEALRTE